MRSRLTIFPALAASALAGCGFHSPPTLSVADLRLGPTQDGAAVVTLVVEAVNTENEPLPLGAATYELTIDGQQAYRGRWDAQATVPRHGSVRFELPATIDASRLPAQGQAAYALRGTVEYVPPGALGEALFNAKVRRGSASFREQGDLTLTRSAAEGG